MRSVVVSTNSFRPMSPPPSTPLTAQPTRQESASEPQRVARVAGVGAYIPDCLMPPKVVPGPPPGCAFTPRTPEPQPICQRRPIKRRNLSIPCGETDRSGCERRCPRPSRGRSSRRTRRGPVTTRNLSASIELTIISNGNGLLVNLRSRCRWRGRAPLRRPCT